jgi:hypothetical protein
LEVTEVQERLVLEVQEAQAAFLVLRLERMLEQSTSPTMVEPAAQGFWCNPLVGKAAPLVKVV